jgi:hypothetical protein
VALIWLINVVTNLAFFFRFSAETSSPANSNLGARSRLSPSRQFAYNRFDGSVWLRENPGPWSRKH